MSREAEGKPIKNHFSRNPTEPMGKTPIRDFLFHTTPPGPPIIILSRGFPARPETPRPEGTHGAVHRGGVYGGRGGFSLSGSLGSPGSPETLMKYCHASSASGALTKAGHHRAAGSRPGRSCPRPACALRAPGARPRGTAGPQGCPRSVPTRRTLCLRKVGLRGATPPAPRPPELNTTTERRICN